jgi:uncharacterized protein (DUF2164 family)
MIGRDNLEHELTINKHDFRLGTLDDELRVDGLCKELLMHFYAQLLADGVSADKATLLATGADYFLRDFVVSIKERNLFDEQAELVRQFAGNWYIMNTLEPNIGELSGYLEGIRSFYRYLHGRELISSEYLDQIGRACDDVPYYASRIESFWEIKGDGYLAWERECTLKDR